MADDLIVTDADAAEQTLRAPEYGGVKYPQIIGWLAKRLQAAGSTNATSVKASAGCVGFIHVFNTNAALRYLKLYDKASAPTVGTDVPVMTIPIPIGGSRNIELPGGLLFTLGIAYAMTTGVADTDTGAVTANDIVGVMGYK